MKTHALVPFALALILAAPVAAQEPVQATTESGRTVLLYPDGTWKYKDRLPAPAASLNKTYVKPTTATDRLQLSQGKVLIHFDPTKWKKDKADEPGVHAYTHVDGDGYAMVMCERLQVPLATLKKVAIENAKEAAQDVKIVSEEKRVVNGKEVLCMQMKGTIQGISFVYLGYYYCGKEGSIQVLTYTGDNLFDEYRKDFEQFLNGFEVVK